jgi:ABC-type multidrug transport system permease subunit
MGSLYWQLDRTTSSMYERFAVLFFAIVFIGFMQSGGIGDLVEQRAIVYREKAGMMYGATASHLGSLVADVPFQLAAAVYFSLIFYFFAGLQLDMYGYFVLGFVLALYCAVGFAGLIASFAPNAAVANALSPTLLSFQFVLSGFVIMRTAIPWYWRWIHYASFFKWAFQFVITIEIGGLTVDCDPKVAICPFQDGQDFIDRFEIVESTTIDVIMMCVFIALFNLLTIVFLNKIEAVKR